MILSTLARAKDAALEQAVLVFLGPKLSRYGELQELSLDTSAKRLSAVVRLHGEASPLVISEARYEIRGQGNETFLVFHSVKASRLWVENLLNDHLQRLPLKIPEFVRGLLE